MTINEVFLHPTVKQVVFQVRFPNLFSMESKIGDFQLKIIKRFPESALLLRRQVVWADVGPGGKLESLPTDPSDEPSKKIWQFKSGDGVEVNVLTNSLDINSQFHKTYNHEGSENKFRDTIEFIMGAFLATAGIPVLTRIGLRYVDECPIPAKENNRFQQYYASTFPLDRFRLEDAVELNTRFTVKRGDQYVRYIESFQDSPDGMKYILDFDGFAADVPADQYLSTTDQLHNLITDEYQRTIREPVYEFMRSGTME
jgi:uncharacterized protein (TIGR04255 family)